MLTATKLAARALREALPADADLGEVCLCLSFYDMKAVNELRRRLGGLPSSERNYWIGTLYTLMISPEKRRSQAAYFTPPDLAEAVIDLAIEQGFDLKKDDVFDPAAGGAAFLSLIAERMRAAGAHVKDIAYRLNGMEIDPSLAEMSESLIARELEGFRERRIVKVGDALHTDPLASYKLVIANPPYGRITPKDLQGNAWERVSHSGHINKYAVFTELCLRVAKPNGLVALVIPSSFRSGPLYDRMRAYIASQGQVLALGTVVNRDDVFADVAQDVSVLLVRKGESHRAVLPTKFPSFAGSGIRHPIHAASLGEDMSAPWLAPSGFEREIGGATIADYGAAAKAGHFVWNREKDKFCGPDDPNAIPLIWAKNIRAGRKCVPANRKGTGVDFVQVPQGSTSIAKAPAVVAQRTTNSSQSRRIIAAPVDEVSIAQGFVGENHTIVMTGQDAELLDLLALLLNTKAVDDRYRAVSGTATVSVKLLRELDLPAPEAFKAALKKLSNPEEAAILAYRAGADRRRLAEAS
ncbi:N-6 DNA methylase [Ensifer sp. ENS02]|nr:N-6 DNA methylase [Ensifer sp. ENS02]MBD9522785.1 N-6 DNA methylase [Ensifer sp. ENS02]